MPALRPGDAVSVVAPAGPFERAVFDAGLARLAARYRPVYPERIFARRRYLAGSDAERRAELEAAFRDPATRAVFCARGGYGAMRLLPQLAPDLPPKALVGFSDVTALHQWLQVQGRVSLHGPVLTQLAQQPSAACERLFHLLEADEPAPPLGGTDTYVAGIAEGPLLGGNLSVFTRLLGTPYLPPLDGAVLLFEDLGERPYRLDRMWTHLELAGVFDRVRGIVLGEFTGCEEKEADYHAADVLRELALATGLPCAAGFPIGHGAVNQPVPLGVRVRLDAGARELRFLEPAAGAT